VASERGENVMTMSSILVVPDKFKGTFSSAEVAAALASGLRETHEHVVATPSADGGDGTSAAFLASRGGEIVEAIVSDPLGRPLNASYAVARDQRVAVVDAAAASGLALLAPHELDPLRASTAGTGELIMAAAAHAPHVIVACGGTATIDGGAGAISVLRTAERLPRLTLACDVTTPWERAAALFGPQKGATGPTVEVLAERLNSLASALPCDPRGHPMTGCGGGLSGGLWAAVNAELVLGVNLVLDWISFDALLAQAQLVVTGEGRLDRQTADGKLVSEVARRAAQADIACIAVVGSTELSEREHRAFGVSDVIIASTLAELRDAGRVIGSSLPQLMR
jgi:glycerate kinase